MEQKKPPLTPPRKPIDMVPTANPAVGLNPVTNRPQFLKGNQIWQLATRQGQPAIITDAADLWQRAINYFNWCDANPWTRSELVKHQGSAEEYAVTVGRMYSINELTTVLGVSPSYFRTRKAALSDKEDAGTATAAEIDLLETMHSIENIIRGQQIGGAGVGLFNPNLVSRINGIADNVNQNNTGEVRQSVIVRDAKTADDLKKLDDML